MIFGDFLKALAQLGDRRFLRVLAIGVALSVALLFGIYALFLMAIQALTPDMVDLPVIGPVGGVHSLLGLASLALMLVLSVFLMVPMAGVFAGLFLDDIAAAVEARHFPHLPPARRLGLAEALVETLNLTGLIVALNLLALFLFAVTGPVYILLFWALNGVLLGREYFTLVAQRRLPGPEVAALRRRNRLAIWAAGVLMAVPLTLPLANLVVPVLGAATFTHLFHRLVAAGR